MFFSGILPVLCGANLILHQPISQNSHCEVFVGDIMPEYE